MFKFLTQIIMKKIQILAVSAILLFSVSCKKNGCMDPLANNYSAEAEKDNGTCDFSGNDITEDIIVNTTWVAGKAYIIKNDISIHEDAVLTIEPGVIVKFEEYASLDVAYGNGFGTVKAVGTIDKPIIFTSNSIAKENGQWDGVILYDGATDANEFVYCTFEYGGDNHPLFSARGCNVRFDYCTVKNSSSLGVEMDNGAGFTSFVGNSFNGNTEGPISLFANYVHTLGTLNNFSTGSYVRINSDHIETSGTITWQKQNVPFYITGGLELGSSLGTKLILQPGSILKFDDDILFDVGYYEKGILEAIGTAANPITFTSYSQFPSKGDWRGIDFSSETGNGSKLEFCNIEYGGANHGNVSMSLGGSNPVIVDVVNCNLTNSLHYGIYKDNLSTVPNIAGTVFSGNTDGDKNW